MHGWFGWVGSLNWWSGLGWKISLSTWWFFRASCYYKEIVRWIRGNKTWEISWTSGACSGTSNWIKYRPILHR
jgi:hypothetical protein